MKTVLTTLHAYQSPQAVPLAAAFLKSYLLSDDKLSAKVEVELLDLFCSQPVEECVPSIIAMQPDAVGFSMYLWNREKSCAIAADLRRQYPHMTIFAGGPEVTAQPGEILAESPFDFVIVGEGEIPFLQAMTRLCEGGTLENISGIARLDNGILLCREPETPDLDTIPSPFLTESLDIARYPGILWQLARGCEFGCDFCFDHRGGRRTRRFSMERLREELSLLARKRVAQVFVLDSTFNYHPKRAKEILRLIRKTAPHIHFHFEARSEFIDPEMADLFARVNCSIQIGLQSADPRIHKNVRRFFDPADFADKIGLLNRSGAIFGFDLIYGLPGDTISGFARSIDFALGLLPNHLDIFPLAVLPGTRLAANAENFGLHHLAAPPYTLLDSATFSAEEMREAAKLAVASDIFYSRGKAVAWFPAVLSPLKLTPSAFLGRFYEWLAAAGKEIDEAGLNDHDIRQAQRDFLSEIYKGGKLRRLLPAALDLVDYHHYYAEALLSSPPELPTDRELEQLDLLTRSFRLSDSTRLATFNYEILDILEAGDMDLREFAECFSPNGSFAAIYPRAGEVFTESLDERYFLLLQKLNDAMPAKKLIGGLGLTPDEASSFLEFATAEGILVLS